MAELSDLTRQRVDLQRISDDAYEATVTITLGPDVVRRFTAIAHTDDLPVEVGAYGRTWPKNAPWWKQARDLSWWMSREQTGKAPSKDTDAARQAWWSGASKDFRALGRRRLVVFWREGQNRGRVASGHVAPQSELAAWARWWHALPKSGRDRLYNKHAPESSFLEDVGSALKEVATNKVFQMAAGALVTMIPGAGAVLGPAIVAASAVVKTAKKLHDSSIQSRIGNKDKAAQLTAEAVSDAKRLTKTPAAASALLKHANDKRKAVEALAAGKPAPSKSKPSTPAIVRAPARPAPKPMPRAPDGDAVLRAARAGRLRSNKPGGISASELLAAHKAGRIFWVSAA